MKFRKKPVIIEAVQYTADEASYNAIIAMGCKPNQSEHDGSNIRITTLEGEHICSVNDWVIKGVKGEFYPCKPDIFEMTYEPVSAIHD